ncbi:unnamed protein product [Gordionus sp. m RMFG-2023]
MIVKNDNYLTSLFDHLSSNIFLNLEFIFGKNSLKLLRKCKRKYVCQLFKCLLLEIEYSCHDVIVWCIVANSDVRYYSPILFYNLTIFYFIYSNLS